MSIVIRHCVRCGHSWPQRSETKPKQCPECRSPYWAYPSMKASYNKNNGLWFISEYSETLGWFVLQDGFPDKKSAIEAIAEIRTELQGGTPTEIKCYRCETPIQPEENSWTLKYLPGGDKERYYKEIQAVFCEKCSPIISKELDKGTFKFKKTEE